VLSDWWIVIFVLFQRVSYVFMVAHLNEDTVAASFYWQTMGNPLHLEWRRWKLEVVMFPWWIVIVSQFQGVPYVFAAAQLS